ncbi:MAG: hypothetical protein D6808_07350, partial [Candidatus Dadabacteria bacterium]
VVDAPRLRQQDAAHLDLEVGFRKDGRDLREPLREYVSNHLFPSTLGVGREIVAAASHHLSAMFVTDGSYKIRQEGKWVFPDGLIMHGPYFVFSSGGVDFGVMKVSYGVCYGIDSSGCAKPIAIVKTVQGVQGVDTRKLPVGSFGRREMLEHFLSRCAPLWRAGFEIGLSPVEKNRKLIDPYFRHRIKDPERVFSPVSIIPKSILDQYHPLRSPGNNKGVRRILYGFKGRQPHTPQR